MMEYPMSLQLCHPELSLEGSGLHHRSQILRGVPLRACLRSSNVTWASGPCTMRSTGEFALSQSSSALCMGRRPMSQWSNRLLRHSVRMTTIVDDSRSRGFSLIELMLVIAIIAVVGAIALPRYSNSLHAYRANLAAKRIAMDLQMAQFRARSLSTTRTVAFTLSSSSYQIAGETDLVKSSATYSVTLSDLPYRATITSAQFGTTAGTSSITFNGFGMPNNGGSITLTSGNVNKIITVAPFSGAISI